MSSHFTHDLQRRIGVLFVEALEELANDEGMKSTASLTERLAACASLLRQKLEVTSGRDASRATDTPTKGNFLFNGPDYTATSEFVSRIPTPLLPLFAELDAKLVDVQWRVRKTAGIQVINALTQTLNVATGDTFREVVGRLAAAKVPAERVQLLLRDVQVWPSLTTHPTNPTSLAYTMVANELDRLLAHPTTTSAADLKVALRAIILTEMDQLNSRASTATTTEGNVGGSAASSSPSPPQLQGQQGHHPPAQLRALLGEVGRFPDSAASLRKTPTDEALELFCFLRVLYETVPIPYRSLRSALVHHPEYRAMAEAPGVIGPLLETCLWGPGDADGNPSMKGPVLEQFVLCLTAALMYHYVRDLSIILEKSTEVHVELGGRLDNLIQRATAVLHRLQSRLNWHERQHGLSSTASLMRLIASCYPTVVAASGRALHDPAATGNSPSSSTTATAVVPHQQHPPLITPQKPHNPLLDIFPTSQQQGDTADEGGVEGASGAARHDNAIFRFDDLTAFIYDAKSLLTDSAAAFPDSVKDLVQDFGVRLATFNLHFARIDVRHNSRDVMAAVAHLLHASDNFNVDDFIRSSQDTQAGILRSRLRDNSFNLRVRKGWEIASHVPEGVRDLWRRLLVMAKYPSHFGKFIIAETDCVANSLAAALLLRAAGASVFAPGSLLDIVPLFESRNDLSNAQVIMHDLLTDPIYRQHCRHRGHVICMIAKSDTARLSGPGVQGAQEATMGTLLSMCSDQYDGIRMFVMLGGGDDQMRGGGRIVESPHVVLRAQAREGGSAPTKIAMTVQGMQLSLLFGSTLLASHFIEGFAAQLLLANAQASRLLPWRVVPIHINEISAAKHTRLFFERAMDNYERIVGPVGTSVRATLVDYLNGFPGEIIEWTNKSSRPGARKKTVDPFEGRAIGLDQRAKHDGGYMTATLGVADALHFLSRMLRAGGNRNDGSGTVVTLTATNASDKKGEKGGQQLLPSPSSSSFDAHRHAYQGNKAFRDFVRMQSTVLFQKDYPYAWALRGGVPSYLERQELEAAYVPGGYNPARVFLAHMEREDLLLAALLTSVVDNATMTSSGIAAAADASSMNRPSPSVSQQLFGANRPSAVVTTRTPLTIGWPDLAASMRSREELSLAARVIQLPVVTGLRGAKGGEDNDHSAAPNGGVKGMISTSSSKPSASRSGIQIERAVLRRLAYLTYVAINPSVMTPNFALSVTDPNKATSFLLRESNLNLTAVLRAPKWSEPAPPANASTSKI